MGPTPPMGIRGATIVPSYEIKASFKNFYFALITQSLSRDFILTSVRSLATFWSLLLFYSIRSTILDKILQDNIIYRITWSARKLFSMKVLLKTKN